MPRISGYIEQLLEGRSLSLEQAGDLLDRIFDGDVPEAQVAAFLTAMRVKGPTAPELAGLAASLRSHAIAVDVDVDRLVDTCGTGGGRVKTFNVSTAAAIVAAGAGVYVAKHGNRGITSGFGSADVLEELGVKIDAVPGVVAECIRQARIGFMFAPVFHPAMKYVQPVRRALGFRTVFNVLGPLANPAGAKRQVLGVGDEQLMRLVIDALQLLGAEYAMVVHAEGMDEISTLTSTRIFELKAGQVTEKRLNPRQLGIACAEIESLKAGDSHQSAAFIRNILGGKESGPPRDIVALNAAAAIVAADLADDFPGAIEMAHKAIRSGSAAECLEKLIEISNKA